MRIYTYFATVVGIPLKVPKNFTNLLMIDKNNNVFLMLSNTIQGIDIHIRDCAELLSYTLKTLYEIKSIIPMTWFLLFVINNRQIILFFRQD